MSLSRRSLLKSTSALTAMTVLPLAGCSRSDAPAKASSASDVANAVLADATDMMLRSYPETASSMGVDSGEYKSLKSKLSDRSQEGQDAVRDKARALLARFEKIDIGLLDADLALDVNVVRTVFRRTSEGFNLPYGDVALLNANWSYRNSPYAVAQNTGSFVEIPSFLETSHKIENDDDAQAYLARMKAYAGQLEGEAERARKAGEIGVILPDFLMKKTLGQLHGAFAQPASEWGIVKYIAGQTEGLNGSYRQDAEVLADEYIRPAIAHQIAVLESLAPHATPEPGMWARPEGGAYYEWALQASTTTKLTPDEVHQIGRDELDALHGRMDTILREIGYPDGTVGERMILLGKDKRYLFSEGDKGRNEILEVIHDALADIRPRLPNAFDTLVPGFLEVARISPDVENGAPTAYGGPGSIDGKKPGHFWINLRTPALHNKFSLRDLTYHEAIPGHVWQGEYTFKQPIIRSLIAFNAYSEGWALYAEQLADELGVYDSFKVGRLGYLQALAFRACRLIVDTGLHAKGWTREQAVDWFVTRNGSNYQEVQSEVDRYCAWPAQACGYKIGHTTINRLRDKAEAELGEKYRFQRFNDALLLGGNVPMTVLNDVIDGYIDKAAKA